MFLKDLKNVLATSCPLDELNKMDKEITNAINSGAFASNLFNNIMEILNLVNEESSHMSIEEVGCFMGKLYKLVITETPHNLRFLADSTPMMSGNSTWALDFINAFFQATSDVPLSQNQCINGTTTFLPTLASAVEQLYRALATRTGIKEALVNFAKTAYLLKGVESYCHLISLASELSILTTFYEISIISWRLARNFPTVASNIKDAYASIKSREFKGVGTHVGKVFQILLNYHTQ